MNVVFPRFVFVQPIAKDSFLLINVRLSQLYDPDRSSRGGVWAEHRDNASGSVPVFTELLAEMRQGISLLQSYALRCGRGDDVCETSAQRGGQGEAVDK